MSEQEPLLPITASQQERLEEATAAYEMELAFTAGVKAYLEARGLRAEAVHGARLGVVSNDPLPEHQYRNGWLAIPYLDQHGRPLTMRFRCLQQHEHGDFHHGKYMSQLEDPSRTYNVGAIHRAARGEGGDSSIHICEGELDALILRQVGLHAIAIPGAKNWQPRHRRMLAGFNEVHVWADGDTPGQEFARKVAKAIRHAHLVRMPNKTDVGELYVQVGQEGLMATLRGER